MAGDELGREEAARLLRSPYVPVAVGVRAARGEQPERRETELVCAARDPRELVVREILQRRGSLPQAGKCSANENNHGAARSGRSSAQLEIRPLRGLLAPSGGLPRRAISATQLQTAMTAAARERWTDGTSEAWRELE